MNKEEMIRSGYKYIATQCNESKIELWAKFNGYLDTISYIYYVPEIDTALEQTRKTISYLQLDAMAQIRDKMREEFLKMNIEHDKENKWINMKKTQPIPNVLYRHDEGMEHIIVYQDGLLLSDEYEGFPLLTAKQILECLERCGIIELEEETIE